MSVNKKTHAETIADIVAWLRKPREGENAYLTLWRDEIADRLEAAYKREKAAIEADALAVGGIVEAERQRKRGNSAALRNALNLCVDEMCARCRDLAKARGNPAPCLNGCEPVRKAKAALAAPPRNCERFGSSTQARAEWYKTEVLPRVEGVVSGVEPPFVDWLFAPATEKEGGNNGNE